MLKAKNSFTLIGTTLLVLSVVLSVALLVLVVTTSNSNDLEVIGEKNEDSQPVHQVRPIIVTNLKRISVLDDGSMRSVETKGGTVGEALLTADIPLYFADKVSPLTGEWVKDGDQITIDRANPYTLLVDGQEIDLYSHYTKTIDIVSEAGFSLLGLDKIIPAHDEILTPGDQIEVVRVSEEVIVEEVQLSFEVVWQGTEDLEIDQKSLLSAGSPGKVKREIRVRQENGIETQREVNEWVAQAPINEAMGFGTRAVIRSLDTPEGPLEYWRVVRMRVTAYTPSSAGKPPDHPGYGITASGVQAGKGVVAVDPKIVPFRSDIYVPGYGIGFAGDTGGGVKGRFIDLGYNDGQIEPWRGYVDVYYLTPLPSPDKINYLIPETLP